MLQASARAAQGVVGSPSLEVFQNHRAVALQDVGRGNVGWLELDMGIWESFPTLTVLCFK